MATASNAPTKRYVILSDTPGANLFALQEGFGMLALQHCQRRDYPGFDASRSRHRDGARHLRHRSASSRIQNMAIADAVFEKKAPRVAAGRKRAIGHVQHPGKFAVLFD